MAATSCSLRTDVRRQSRALARRCNDQGVHLARVHASMQLEGVEPVQGALADLFACFDDGTAAASLKRAALQLAAPRLGERMTRRFEAWVAAPALPRITPLATRWSLFVQPSADMASRSRRCSADDSRAIARQALAACEAQDTAGQELFLHHCLTCQDRLAFMLVRRELLRRNLGFPGGWVEVERTLQRQAACP